jgi:hypothetical protein
VPVYSAPVEDLKPGDAVVIACGACGARSRTAAAIQECDAKGNAVVSVRDGESDREQTAVNG